MECWGGWWSIWGVVLVECWGVDLVWGTDLVGVDLAENQGMELESM